MICGLLLGSQLGTDLAVWAAALAGCVRIFGRGLDKPAVKVFVVNEDDEDFSTWEVRDFLEEKFPELQFNAGIEEYYDDWCIGMEFESMKDNETKKDFIKRVEGELEKLVGKKVKAEPILDAGRDG